MTTPYPPGYFPYGPGCFPCGPNQGLQDPCSCNQNPCRCRPVCPKTNKRDFVVRTYIGPGYAAVCSPKQNQLSIVNTTAGGVTLQFPIGFIRDGLQEIVKAGATSANTITINTAPYQIETPTSGIPSGVTSFTFAPTTGLSYTWLFARYLSTWVLIATTP